MEIYVVGTKHKVKYFETEKQAKEYFKKLESAFEYLGWTLRVEHYDNYNLSCEIWVRLLFWRVIKEKLWMEKREVEEIKKDKEVKK